MCRTSQNFGGSRETFFQGHPHHHNTNSKSRPHASANAMGMTKSRNMKKIFNLMKVKSDFTKIRSQYLILFIFWYFFSQWIRIFVPQHPNLPQEGARVRANDTAHLYKAFLCLSGGSEFETGFFVKFPEGFSVVRVFLPCWYHVAILKCQSQPFSARADKTHNEAVCIHFH